MSSAPDNLARGVSILALLVASGGLYLSWKTYRRGGAQIKVKLSRSNYTTYADGPMSWPILLMLVQNVGHASVQVTGVWFDVKNAKEVVERNPSGPTIPTTLAGNSEVSWTPNLSTVANAALGDAESVKVRAVVQIAGDRLTHSGWITIERADMA